jgi:hypothetical protein
MREKNIKVIIVEPSKPVRIETIANELKTLQGIVGGLVERLDLDGFDILFNEEGKLEDLEPNFGIFDGMDYIAGTAVFAGVNYNTGEWTSLNEKQIQVILLNFIERV